jgi:2-succinyl-5-enolpyruvyl-6-hydroxy-3-cyclohexene-1-carboxylate synthase
VDVEQPGRGLNRDLATRSDEAAEAEIDRFIQRRAKVLERENKERAEEAAFLEQTRKSNEEYRQQVRREWHAHHTTQAARLRNTLEQLIEHHEQRAEELMGSGGDAA